jgi:hypothetical protein
MIELRANNNGNELKVKEGKQIEIALAGYNLSNGYDLYYTSDGSSWSQTGQFVSDSNYQRNNRIKELSIIPKVPTDTVDMGKDFIFSLKADLTEVPYLKPFSNLQWRVSKKDMSSKVIEAIRIIWDEVSIKQIKGNKLENELVFKRKQFDTSGNQIVEQLVVKASPIVGGKNNREDRKLFAQQMDMYKNTLAKIEEEKTRLSKEADMLNSFTISKMGIWNIDKIMKRDDLILVNASFDFEKEINSKVDAILESAKSQKDEEKKSKMHFFNFLAESKRNEFESLTPAVQEKIVDLFENTKWYGSIDANNIWESAFAKPVAKNDWLANMPNRYAESWNSLNESQKNAIKAQASVRVLDTQYQIDSFWSSRDLRVSKVESTETVAPINESSKYETPTDYMETVAAELKRRFKR